MLCAVLGGHTAWLNYDVLGGDHKLLWGLLHDAVALTVIPLFVAFIKTVVNSRNTNGLTGAQSFTFSSPQNKWKYMKLYFWDSGFSYRREFTLWCPGFWHRVVLLIMGCVIRACSLRLHLPSEDGGSVFIRNMVSWDLKFSQRRVLRWLSSNRSLPTFQNLLAASFFCFGFRWMQVCTFTRSVVH